MSSSTISSACLFFAFAFGLFIAFGAYIDRAEDAPLFLEGQENTDPHTGTEAVPPASEAVATAMEASTVNAPRESTLGLRLDVLRSYLRGMSGPPEPASGDQPAQ